MARHDSLLALAFDRTPTVEVYAPPVDPSEGRSFQLCMDQLTHITLRNGVNTGDKIDLASIRSVIVRIEAVGLRVNGRHLESAQITTIQQRCEILLIDLHFAFVMAWLCRPVLRETTIAGQKTPAQQELIDICLKSLRKCLKSFIALQSMCTFASRSWAVIHNGLSSALLLALLGETSRDEAVKGLLDDLLSIFPEMPQTGELRDQQADMMSPNLSAPHMRTLQVLRRIRSEQNILPGASCTEAMAAPNPVVVPVENLEPPMNFLLVPSVQNLCLLRTNELRFPQNQFLGGPMGTSTQTTRSETYGPTLNPNPDWNGCSLLDTFDSIIW